MAFNTWYIATWTRCFTKLFHHKASIAILSFSENQINLEQDISFNVYYTVKFEIYFLPRLAPWWNTRFSRSWSQSCITTSPGFLHSCQIILFKFGIDFFNGQFGSSFVCDCKKSVKIVKLDFPLTLDSTQIHIYLYF